MNRCESGKEKGAAAVTVGEYFPKTQNRTKDISKERRRTQMIIITEYNDKEITEEQLEALAASMLAQMIEYYKKCFGRKGE